MGVVYLARDTRLDRDVAIKALPPELAADADRLARFELEAKTLAQLAHSHIAGIHGLEEHEGRRYLVLEYVEGETLAQRLGRGRLALDEALELAIGIATGVEAAHEAGVIHRDLKPDNVRITPDQRVKVLDFGLARIAEPPEAAADSVAGTVTSPRSPTIPGAILGTAPYMSPEQARGRVVDRRTDVWSFGVILYEMLTGSSPFQGETLTDSIAAVLHKDLNPVHLAGMPPGVRRVLSRCLERDRSRRYRDIGDARLDLEEARDASPETAGGRPAASGASRLGLPIGMALGAALAAGLFVSFGTRGPDAAPPGPLPDPAAVRTEIALPEGETITRSVLGAVAFTPDGSTLVFSTVHDGARRLYRRRLDGETAVRIEGTEGGAGPVVSPDGQSVAFWARAGLWRAPLTGGSAVRIHDLTTDGASDAIAMAWVNDLGSVSETVYGTAWTADDRILYARFVGGLWSLPATGGAPAPLTALADGEFAHRTPRELPGGRGVLFTVISGVLGWDSRVEVLRPDGSRQRLLEEASDARFLPPGHLVFARRGALHVVGFDLERLAVVGEERRVLPGVMHAIGGNGPGLAGGTAQFAVSSRGDLAYVPGNVRPDVPNELVWLDASGGRELVTEERYPFLAPRLSPDGTTLLVAAMRSPGRNDLYRYDLDRRTFSRLQPGAIFGIWSAEGEEVFFAQREGLFQSLFRASADGSGTPERLTQSAHLHTPSSASPDGRLLVYVESHPATGNDIRVLDLQTGEDSPWRVSPGHEGHPAFSPDGEWLAYVSDESGRHELYVERFADHAGRLQLTRSGASAPVWRRDGSGLYFIEAPDSSHSVGFLPCTLGDAPSFGAPTNFTRQRVGGSTPVGGFDVSPDGARILARQQTDPGDPDGTSDQVRLIVGWWPGG